MHLRPVIQPLLLILSLSGPVLSFAQELPGYNSSNYAGINGVDLQPASIADSRYVTDIQLFGLTFNAYNNYLGIKSTAFRTPGAFEQKGFMDQYTIQRESGKPKSLFLNNEILLPSFMVNAHPRYSFGFTAKVRTYFNLDGVGNELATLIREELEYPSLWISQLHNKNLSIQSMSWAEYGFPFAGVLIDRDDHFLKAGGRVKALHGLQAFYLFIDDLFYEFTNEDTVTIFKTHVSYGHSDNFRFDPSGGVRYRANAKLSAGVDLGVVYEWRHKSHEFRYNMDGESGLWRKNRNKYKLKVGASLLDIGRLRFKKGQFSHDFEADIKFLEIQDLKVESVEEWDSLVRTKFVFREDEDHFFMNLPAAFSLQADYRIWKNLYVNATPYWAMKMKKDKEKVHGLTVYSLTPRWDAKWYGLFVPLTWDELGNRNIGMALRIGPLITGTRNLSALFARGHIFGADAYFLLKVPIMYGWPKDSDNDYVSNKKDLCRDIPGIWEFKGCPDTDGDHIQDSEDLCPKVFGKKEHHGCPDSDSDGIGDLEDDCIDVQGVAWLKGCPDADSDSTKDSEDDCPYLAGPKENRGCPDADGDGVIDNKDECPNLKGTADNLGCPEVRLVLLDDSGKVVMTAIRNPNGIFVFEKLPPDKHYVFRMEGDDVFLTEDLLILFKYEDKETLLTAKKDPEHKFAYRYLPPDTMAGPKLIEEEDVAVMLRLEEKEIVNKAFSNLEFNTASAVISRGFGQLEELTELLKKNAAWRLKLEGHTDDVGEEIYNLSLSKRRAEAVERFMREHGVAEDRLVVKFFGETQPVATNDTEEGRQKNRRVEMTIIE